MWWLGTHGLFMSLIKGVSPISASCIISELVRLFIGGLSIAIDIGRYWNMHSLLYANALTLTPCCLKQRPMTIYIMVMALNSYLRY